MAADNRASEVVDGAHLGTIIGVIPVAEGEAVLAIGRVLGHGVHDFISDSVRADQGGRPDGPI